MSRTKTRLMRSSVSDSVAEKFIDQVLGGKVVACRYVKLMCKRHRNDIKNGHKRGLYFDPTAAQHVIDFFGFLRHSKGEWAGRVVELEPWQQAILWILFGWYRKDGTRRFRACHLDVARKNGKSTVAAGVGLYLMVADGEPGAEVYSAATKREQARITHSEAQRMVKASPTLRKRIVSVRDNLHIRDTATKFEPLGRDSDTMDGLNVHAAIVDELHAHRNNEVWSVLETATGSRRQPLMFGITTAGFNQASFCFEQRDYAIKVLEEIVQDDAFFACIFTLDEGDDWTDERTWCKANPNLGVSVKLDDLRDKAQRARTLKSQQAQFLTKHLNMWVNAAGAWVHPDKWKACGGAFDEEELAGRPCYGGLDLSNTLDITAWVLIFPPWGNDDKYRALCRFWVPEDSIEERARNDRVPYDVWVKEGYIEKTPGAVVDYEFIYAQIGKDAERFDIKEIGYDRWGAAEVYLRLGKEEMEMIQVGQGFASMSPPMKKLEELITSGGLAHGDNPVLTWMAHNVVALADPAGNIKPDKKKSREKVDGVVALIMALDRATRHDPEADTSAYDERGIRFV